MSRDMISNKNIEEIKYDSDSEDSGSESEEEIPYFGSRQMSQAVQMAKQSKTPVQSISNKDEDSEEEIIIIPKNKPIKSVVKATVKATAKPVKKTVPKKVVLKSIVRKEEKIEFEPENSLGFCLKKGFSLYPHQFDVIEWMHDRAKNVHHGIRGGILALKMGLGKTLTALSFIMSIKEDMPSLVICSKSVLYTWKNDIEKFFGPSCPYLLYHKDHIKDLNSVTFDQMKHYKIILTSYEVIMAAAKFTDKYQGQFVKNQFHKNVGIMSALKPSENHLEMKRGYNLLLNIPWTNIVADESQRFVNPKTKIFYSMMTLWGKYRWCLTGTPIVNYSTDIYSQLKFLGYTSEDVTYNFNYRRYVRDNLFILVKAMTYEEAGIRLTELKYNSVYFDFYSEEENAIYAYYSKIMKDVYNDFLKGLASYHCVLEMFLRQRQVCIAPYTILEESSRVKTRAHTAGLSQDALDNLSDKMKLWIHDKNGTAGIQSSKMKETFKILREIPKGEKVLIFTTFKKVIDVLRHGLHTYFPELEYDYLDGDVIGKKREAALDNFKQNPNISVLLISYKVGSEGLNLTEANNVILMDGWWCSAVTEQAKARSHRMGQKKVVNVWKLFAKCSIEDKMEEICQAKTKMADQFLNHKRIKQNQKLDAGMMGRIIF